MAWAYSGRSPPPHLMHNCNKHFDEPDRFVRLGQIRYRPRQKRNGCPRLGVLRSRACARYPSAPWNRAAGKPHAPIHSECQPTRSCGLFCRSSVSADPKASCGVKYRQLPQSQCLERLSQRLIMQCSFGEAVRISASSSRNSSTNIMRTRPMAGTQPGLMGTSVPQAPVPALARPLKAG